MTRRAAFLDRDGVVNVDHGYVHQWDKFEFAAGAVQAMKRLHDADYALVIVTNQSGIARGMYTEEDFQRLTLKMREHLQARGIPLAGVFHCPHHPQGKVADLAMACACRKPEPGLILQALEQLGLDAGASFLVGDKPSDIEAARAAGLGHAYLLQPQTHNARVGDAQAGADASYFDLDACVQAVLKRH